MGKGGLSCISSPKTSRLSLPNEIKLFAIFSHGTKSVKLVKIRAVGKHWIFNLTKYANMCFLVQFYFLLWNTVQWSLTGNLYIAYPVGKGLWSIRALLHSMLNKTLTPYLGSNSTISSFRVSKLTWNLAGDTVLPRTIQTPLPIQQQTSFSQSNKLVRQEQFRKFFPVFPTFQISCLRTS